MNGRTRHLFTRRSPRLGKGLLALWLVCWLTTTSPAFGGLPQGGKITHGEGSISTPSATQMQIDQYSQRMAADFISFDIAANHGVNIDQPGASAIFLGNISGESATQIFGTLTATGQVMLMNPRGVVFGETARVDTASLIATTLGVDVDRFMSGVLELELSADIAGKIINRGVLNAATGGSITLLGDEVINEGLIVADMGRVNLTSASQAFVTFDPDGLIGVRVTEGALGGSGGDAAVANLGEIQANGGQILLTAHAARDLFSMAVNNEGVLRANSAEKVDGEIRLFASGGDTFTSGTIEATSESGEGGRIEVLGDRIAVTGGRIDASGAGGGGDIKIGGAFQGKGDTPTASHTYVGPDAKIAADATVAGDGGEVIVWADDTMRFHGEISARGGPEGGDGGFVEVSGKEHLVYRGSTDTRAPQGRTGTLLLDPTNINITDDVDDVGMDTSDDPFVPTNPDPDAESTLTWSTILTNLDSANVHVTTVAGFDAGQDGDITIVESPNQQGESGAYDHENQLRLTTASSGSIIINAEVANAGSGGIVLDSNTISLNANLSTNSGTIVLGDMLAGNVLLGGNVALSTGAGAGDITFSGTLDGTTPGTETLGLTAGTGSVTFADVVGAGTALGAVTLVSAADVNLDAAFTAASLTQAAGAGTTTVGGDLTTSENVALTSDAIAVNAVIDTATAAAGGTVTLNADDNADSGLGLTLAAAGDISSAGAVTLTGAAGISAAGSVTTSGADITFNSATTLTGNVVLSTGGGAGDITFTNTVNSSGDGAASSAEHDLTLTAGTGSIRFTGAAGGEADGALGDLTIVSAEDVTANAITANNLAQQAGTGTTTLNGPVTLADDLSFTGNELSLNALATAATVSVTGATSLAADVTTTGAQTYDGAMTLSGDAERTLTGSTITLGGGATGTAAGDALDIQGGLVLNGEITSLLSLNVAGTTVLSADVTTTGTQTYGDDVTLAGGARAFTTTGGAGSDLTFAGDIDGTALESEILNLAAGGAEISIVGNVGSDVPVFGFFVGPAETVNLNAVTSHGDQIIVGDPDDRIHAINVDGVLRTLSGSGAELFIDGGGITLNAATEVGGFNVELYGGGQDVIVAADRLEADAITITAPRDVIIQAVLEATGATSDVLVTADTSGNEEGGVLLGESGQIVAGRDAILSGSALFSTLDGADGESIFIVSDGTNEQIMAGANISLLSGTNAPASADIRVEGVLDAGRNISIEAAGDILLGTTLTTAGSDISLDDPVVLVGNTLLSTGGGDGDITFGEGVTGPFALEILAGTGVVSVPNAVGVSPGDGDNPTAVTVTSAASVSLNDVFVDGALAIDAGTINLTGAEYRTNSSAITFTGDVVLDQDVTVSTAGGDITLGDTVSSDNALSLDAGTTGVIAASSFLGGGDLTVVDSASTTFTGGVAAGDLTLTNTQGLIAFEGNIDIGALFTTDAAYDLAFTGTTNTVGGNTVFLNTGSLMLGHVAGDSFDFMGGVDTTMGPSVVSLGGTFATSNADMILGDVSLTAATTLTTGAGGGDLDLGTVTANTQALSLNAGGGTIGLNALFDGGNLTVVDSASGNFGVLEAEAISLQNTAGTIAFDASVDATGITADANGFDVTFNAAPDFSGAGTFNNTGGVTFNAGGSFDDGLTVSGTTTLTGSLATANSPLVLNALTLAGTAMLVSGGAAIDTGAITAGGNALTFNAGADGEITVASFAGTSGLTLANSGGTTFSNTVDAGAISLVDTNGTVTFDAPVTAASITADANDFAVIFGAAPEVSGSGSFANEGGVSFAAGGSFSDGLTVAGPAVLTDTLATVGSAIDLNAVMLSGTALLNSAGGDISTGAIASSGQALTLNAGATGEVAIASFADGGDLSLVNSAQAVFAGTVAAGNVTLEDTEGLIAFAGDASLGALTTSAAGYDLAFTGTTNTIGGSTSFLNTGAVTLGDDAGDNTTFAGGVDTTGGPTSVAVAGTVATSNSNMLLGPITVNAASTLTTGSGSGNLTTGAIARGSNALTLNAGTGNVQIASIAGNGALTLTNASNAEFLGAVTASTADLLNASGTIGFRGDTSISTGLTTAASGYSVAFTGTTNTVAGNTTFLNSGSVTLGDALGDSITFAAGLDTTATAGTSIAGTVATSSADMSLGAVSLTAASTLSTGSGSGDITTGVVSRGTNALTLAAGSGDMLLDSIIGSGVLTVATAGDAVFSGPVAASTLALNDITGLVAFQGNTSINTGLVTAANGYDLAFTGSSNTVAGSTAFQNSGALTLGDDGSDSITFVGGVDATAGPSSVNLAGTVATDNSDLLLGDAFITAGSSLTTGGGGGDLRLGTLSNGGESVTLNAGSGDIEVASVLGSGVLTVTNAGNATFTGPVTASTVNLNNAAGTIAFRGNTTIDTGLSTAANGFDVAFTGSETLVAGSTEFLNTGTVTFGAVVDDSITFAGGVDTTAASATNVVGSVITSNADMTLGDVVLEGAGILRSGAGQIRTGAVSGADETLTLQSDSAASSGAVVLGGEVALGSLITFGQDYDVSLLGGGTIASPTAFRNLGSVALGDAASDSLMFTGGLSTTGNPTNPSSLSLAGTIATDDAPMRLGSATLTGATTLSTGTTGPGGTLEAGTLDAAGNNLTLRAGTGGSMTIAAVNDAVSAAFASADSVRVSGGLSANTASFGSANTFTVGGPLTLNNLQTQSNSGRLIFTGGGTVMNGVALQNTGGLELRGSDDFLFAGGLDTSAGSLTLSSILRSDSGPLITSGVTLVGNSQIDTTNQGDPMLVGGSVTLGGAVSGLTGNETLEILAGTGNIEAANGVSDLGSFFVRSGNELTLGEVSTTGNTIRTVTAGNVNLNGNVTAGNGDVTIVSLNGGILQGNGLRVTAVSGDAHLIALDRMDLFEVHAPQGDVLLALLSGEAGGRINRIGPPARSTPDFIAGELVTVVSAGRSQFGSVASGFRIQAAQSFISLDDGQSFVDESTALPLSTLDLAKQQELRTVFDQTDFGRELEMPFGDLFVDRILNVIAGIARAQQAISDRAQTQSQAATQQADEEEVLTDLTEDVFVEIMLYDFDRERPLCLPNELQGFDAAPCIGQTEEDLVSYWFDELARDLLRTAANEPAGTPLVQRQVLQHASGVQ